MKKPSHGLEALAVRGFGALARALPASAAEALGRTAGRTALALGLRADVAAANLERAFPERSREERERIRRDAYAQWGAGAVELLRFPRWRTSDLDAVVRSMRGIEHVGEARKLGKGAVLVTGHFGAFEAMGAAVARSGHPVHFLVRGQTNAAVDTMLQSMRRSLGVSVLTHGAGIRGALRVLQKNECLAIVADQDAGRDGIFVDFFGTPASTPRGPAEFAVRTGAPIVTGVLRRLPGGQYDGVALPACHPPASGDREADVRSLTEFYTRALEQWVRRWPEQWLWTHRRWKTRPPGEALAAALLLVVLCSVAPSSQPRMAHAQTPAPAARVAGPDTLRAGDSGFDGAGSSVFPLGPTRVRRLFEGVRIRRVEHGWKIDAEEVFQAGASAVTAAMGLPDYRASLPGDSASAPPRGTVRGLKVTVDGLPMAVTEAPGWAAPGADLGGLERVYRFDVPFASEEIRVVRLEYEIGESRTDRGEPLLFFYLNPGALWQGDAAKVTVSVDLGEVDPEDVIPGWLRPGGYRLYGREVIWHRRAGDEVADIALAFRPPVDPRSAFADTTQGPFSLGDEAREEWLGRLTPRETRYWLAWLEQRHAGRTKPPEREQRLAARLRERLSAFERARITP